MDLTFVFHPIPKSKQIYLRFREKNWKQLGKKEAVVGFFLSHIRTFALVDNLVFNYCYTLDPHQHFTDLSTEKEIIHVVLLFRHHTDMINDGMSGENL